MGWRQILTNRRLMAIAIVPFLISFFAAVAAIWAAWIYHPIFLAAFLPAWVQTLPGPWHGLVYYPVAFASGVLAALASLYVIYILHAILAVPFYALLAERALAMEGKRTVGSGFNFRLLAQGLIKGLVFIGAGLLLFVLSFIPVVNLLAVTGTLLLLAYDCMDYSLEAKGLDWRERLRYMRMHRAQWAGMAGALALTLLLPGLTLLVIPGAVVGAAMILNEAHFAGKSI